MSHRQINDQPATELHPTAGEAGTTGQTSDAGHVHAHGEQPAEFEAVPLHPIVTGATAGFMTPAMLAALAAAGPSTPLSNDPPAGLGTTDPGAAAAASRADHVHAHGNLTGGTLHAVATAAAAGFQSAASAAAEPANWPLTQCRYFLLDDAGSDANPGFIDTTIGGSFPPAGLPKQTIAALLAIIPREGNGRVAVILIRGGASTTYAGVLNLSGISGYDYFAVRGSTDLTNDATDQILCGAKIEEAGPNGDGSWTADGTGSDEITVAAGTLPGSSQAVGYRVRFKGNVTPALTNAIASIWSNDSTTMLFGGSLPATAAAGDEFFIESPGVVLFDGFIDVAVQQKRKIFAGGLPLPSPRAGLTVAASSQLGAIGAVDYAFFHHLDPTETQALTSAGHVDELRFASSYYNEAGDLRAVGGCRTDSQYRLEADQITIGEEGFFCAQGGETGTMHEMRANVYDVDGGNAFAKGVTFECTGGESTIMARADEARSIRVYNVHSGKPAAMQVVGPARVSVAGGFDGNSAVPLISFDDEGDARGTVATVGPVHDTDAGGNTGPAVDVSACAHGKFLLEEGGIVGGAATIRLAGDGGGVNFANAPAVGFSQTNIVDARGNDVMGSGGHVVDTCLFCHNTVGGPINLGELVRGTGGGATPEIAPTIADTEAHTNLMGVAAMAMADGDYGYLAQAGYPVVAVDGAFSVGNLLYLSTTVPEATATSPAIASGFKVRLGPVAAIPVAGFARVAWHPEALGVTADGNP